MLIIFNIFIMSCGRVIDGICAGGSGGDAALTENIDGGDIGDIVTQTAPATTGFTSTAAAGTVLTSNGVLALPSFQTVSSSTSATNLNGGNIGDIATQTSSSTTGFTSTAAAGTVLTSNGALTLPSFQTVSNSTSATNLNGGGTGAIATQTAASTTGFTVPSTSGHVLTSNGVLTLPTFQVLSIPFTLPTITQYTSGSGTFNSTAGCKYIEAYLQAGGGGGAGANANPSSGGGGGGFAYLIMAPGAYSYTVGAAGAAGSSGPGAGGAGGATTLGTNTVNGGGGGSIGASNAVLGGAGGTVGATAITNSVYYRYGGDGGTTHYDPTSNLRFASRGGSSFYTGSNYEMFYGFQGDAGKSYGGGGAGSSSATTTAGTLGGAGYIRIVQYF